MFKQIVQKNLTVCIGCICCVTLFIRLAYATDVGT
jgi:hypothetical protein